MIQQIPLLILAGSDQTQASLPPTLAKGEMLSGFKGTLPLPTGKVLVAELIDRYRASGRFEDPLLLGPRPVYEGLVDCEIVDARGNLVETMRRVQECIRTRWTPETPVAVSASDILPTPAEIQELLSSCYDPHAESKFWWQVIAAEPEALGPSSWKPQYAVRPKEDEAPRTMYPGHLIIFQPHAVRIDLLIQLTALAYRYRNLPNQKRVVPMLLRGMMTLAAQDGRNLGRGQLPILTLAIPWHILGAYAQFRRKTLTIAELERHLGRVLLHRDDRDEPGALTICLTEILSFAKDIDSKQELEALSATMS